MSGVANGERLIEHRDRAANDGALVRGWAHGHGIALKSERNVSADRRAGRLEAPLADHAAPSAP